LPHGKTSDKLHTLSDCEKKELGSLARSPRMQRRFADRKLYADREIGAPGNANLLIGRNHNKTRGTKPPPFPENTRE